MSGNGQERFLEEDSHDLVSKFCATQIMFCNSIFTLSVRFTKIYSKIMSCVKKVTPGAINITHSAKCIQPDTNGCPIMSCHTQQIGGELLQNGKNA